MLDHHIQRAIVYSLAFADTMRFAELKPDDIDSKLFTYHLKKTMISGLVEKTEDGAYALTLKGRRVGKGALEKTSRMIDRAYSILLLAIRRQSDGAWLLYRRQNHPLLGMTGFMQAQPVADEDVKDTAARVCQEQTGLAADFLVHSHGYFKVFRGGQIESFIHFTLLQCESIEGDIKPIDSDEYYWDTAPDFTATDMLPNMAALHTTLQSPAGSFIDETFNID